LVLGLLARRGSLLVSLQLCLPPWRRFMCSFLTPPLTGGGFESQLGAVVVASRWMSVDVV